jgi:hypothetical protein
MVSVLLSAMKVECLISMVYVLLKKLCFIFKFGFIVPGLSNLQLVCTRKDPYCWSCEY